MPVRNSTASLSARILQALLLLLLAGYQAHCQTRQAPIDSLGSKYAELVRFYEGKWKGTGEFSNGRKIEAVVTFRKDSICQCLVFRHEDLPPGQWKTTGILNLARAEQKLLALYNDTYSGARLFTGSHWTDSRLILLREVPGGTAKMRFERFVFEKQAADAYKMTWEISGDGKSWNLGDYLVFRKM